MAKNKNKVCLTEEDWEMMQKVGYTNKIVEPTKSWMVMYGESKPKR